MPREKGLSRSLDSLPGGPGIATGEKIGWPRSILVPSLKPWLPLDATTDKLQIGVSVGDYWPCHEGAFRMCQAKEDLTPGRATYWAGAEEGRSSAKAPATARTILDVKRGDKKVYVETIGSFDVNDFQDGLLRITGGTSAVAGRYFTIAHNEESYLSTEISGTAARYVTPLTLREPINVDLDQDTDWHIQGNLFACQRHAPGALTGSADHTDQPRFTVGVPRVPVKADEYYWDQVQGPALLQLLNAITAVNCISGQIDLMPYIGTNSDADTEKAKLGKFVAIDAAADVPSQIFARLTVRTETAFAADAFAPAYLYGSAGM